MEYLNYNTYSILYDRYLQKGCDYLFEGIDLKGKSVLDLCCGSGRASYRAMELGAKEAIGIDKCIDMIDHRNLLKFQKLIFVTGDVVEYLESVFANVVFVDVAICQQAINYWFYKTDFVYLANILNSNGVFIFNTFNKKPQFKTKEYSLQFGPICKNYVEISYMLNERTVQHIQVCDGYPPHLTCFDWVPREDIIEKLDKHFKLCEHIDGNSSRWVCKKRK